MISAAFCHTMAWLALLVPATILCAGEERFPNLASHSALPEGPGLAAKFRADLGIASHAAVIFADDFESGELGSRWDEKGAGGGKALSLTPAGGGVCGHRCMKIEARLGVNQGDGLTKWFEPVDPEFVRFYVRFDP